jgi:3-hydroxy acid dehydrogenase / malonic semialdehyde reductase
MSQITDPFQSKRVLITGASAGIGKAMALTLAPKGYELYLLARREERLKELQQEIQLRWPETKVRIIAADVNDPSALALLAKATDERIDILINNAGLALGRDRVAQSHFQDFQQMIDTNITANFRLVHLVLPWMLKARGGDIINLCSIAGHYSYPGGAVYCATKHAVHAFTRALREETAGTNVRVMQISPGMVETEFSQVRFKGDEGAAQAVYANVSPLTAQDIAEMMLFMLERPRHVVIDEIITMPSQQGSPHTIVRSGR